MTSSEKFVWIKFDTICEDANCGDAEDDDDDDDDAEVDVAGMDDVVAAKGLTRSPENLENTFSRQPALTGHQCP